VLAKKRETPVAQGDLFAEMSISQRALAGFRRGGDEPAQTGTGI
jgi:hypothetical protein